MMIKDIKGGEDFLKTSNMASKSSFNNSHIMYLAMMALGLLLVPFLVQAIKTNAVAQYKASYAAEQGR